MQPNKNIHTHTKTQNTKTNCKNTKKACTTNKIYYIMQTMQNLNNKNQLHRSIHRESLKKEHPMHRPLEPTYNLGALISYSYFSVSVFYTLKMEHSNTVPKLINVCDRHKKILYRAVFVRLCFRVDI